MHHSCFKDMWQLRCAEAFGQLSANHQPVLGDLDMLVVGFSCKDLSMLNHCRKRLAEKGKSGSTLRGVLNSVERYRQRCIVGERRGHCFY